MPFMVGERPRSGVVALIAALVPALVAATLVPAPAQAADPLDHLSVWTMEADFTYTEVTSSPGGSNNFSFDASYADYSTDSFVATWSGSSSMTNTYSCDGGGQGGYHIEGNGAGAGEYWRETGFPTDYGLTGACYSNNREHIEYARREFNVGNLYLNRKCTGALVGVQPFGGFNMSGTDS